MDDFAGDWIGWAYWVGGLGGFLGIVICAIMMMIGRRNRHNMSVDGATGMLWVIGGLCLLVMAGSIVTGVLTESCGAAGEHPQRDRRRRSALPPHHHRPDCR